MRQRLQKLMSAAGHCSRRQAEELLRQGRVEVNGRTAGLGDQADPEIDQIEAPELIARGTTGKDGEFFPTKRGRRS